MVLYNDSIWKRLVSLRRGINVMKAKHLQNWMKWMNVRSRKFYVGCERWEVRSWKWGFWLLTSHFPFQIYGIWRKKLNWAPRSGRWESNENSHNWSIPLRSLFNRVWSVWSGLLRSARRLWLWRSCPRFTTRHEIVRHGRTTHRISDTWSISGETHLTTTWFNVSWGHQPGYS